MGIQVGTRTRQLPVTLKSDSRRWTQSVQRDKGLSKYTVGAMTFSATTATGAAGVFAAFKVGDIVAILGTASNNGFQTITVLAGGNVLTGDKGFVAEVSPATTQIRTI